ncbi:hypothetical protein C4577_04230 [Candidatus Parcubacteria bacterium]|nr:MAG: hypothetical protein C4577_04230 [Candidatus Parcubacteria bacterium]
MNSDLINGLFEVGGAIFLSMNCRQIYKDKCTRGISPLPFIFYTSWGYWNLFYYPNINQWYSFYGGIGVVAVNTVYLFQLWWYRGK